MNTMFEGIKRFVREEDGASAVEYALLAAIIGIGIVASTGTLKDAIVTAFTNVGTAITTASGG